MSKILALLNNRLFSGLLLAALTAATTAYIVGTQKEPALQFLDIQYKGGYPLHLDTLVRDKDLSVIKEGKKFPIHVPSGWAIYNYSDKPLDSANFEIVIPTEFSQMVYLTHITVRGSGGEIQQDLSGDRLTSIKRISGDRVTYPINIHAINPSRGDARASIDIGYLLDKIPDSLTKGVRPIQIKLAPTTGWAEREWDMSNTDKRPPIVKFWATYSPLLYFIMILIFLSTLILLISKPLTIWENKRWKRQLDIVFGNLPGNLPDIYKELSHNFVPLLRLAMSYRKVTPSDVSKIISNQKFGGENELEK
jgi:hypothetical protein